MASSAFPVTMLSGRNAAYGDLDRVDLLLAPGCKCAEPLHRRVGMIGPKAPDREGKSTNQASAGLERTDAPETWTPTLLLEISIAEMVGRPGSPHVKSHSLSY